MGAFLTDNGVRTNVTVTLLTNGAVTSNLETGELGLLDLSLRPRTRGLRGRGWWSVARAVGRGMRWGVQVVRGR